DTIIADITGDTDSIVSFKQGMEETILILKGETPDELASQVQRLSEFLQGRMAAQMAYLAMVGVGHPTERLGAIAQSFAQALAQITTSESPTPAEAPGLSDHHYQEQSPSAALIAKARSYI